MFLLVVRIAQVDESCLYQVKNFDIYLLCITISCVNFCILAHLKPINFSKFKMLCTDLHANTHYLTSQIKLPS